MANPHPDVHYSSPKPVPSVSYGAEERESIVSEVGHGTDTLCRVGVGIPLTRETVSLKFECCQFLLKYQPSNIEVKAGREDWRWGGNDVIDRRAEVVTCMVGPCVSLYVSTTTTTTPPLSRPGMTGQREDASRGSQISKYHPSHDQY